MPVLKDQCRLVVLVEDEWLLRDEIATALRNVGWEVFEAASAEDAMALLREHEISVVFTDIRLQGSLTGWDLAEASRA
jgi:DNA-binding NtrC family response regulator